MTTRGRARRAVLQALCPAGHVVVDVGADHGLVAQAVGAFASERTPHLVTPRAGVSWIVANGLAPFRRVDVAIIAGMGARSIARILEAGPTPLAVVLHAQDDPRALRQWLARSGWRIDAEQLAPEGRGFAEVIRAFRGQEPSTGLRLELGPVLLESDDPWLSAHLDLQIARYAAIANATRGRAPEAYANAAARRDFLQERKSHL